MRPSATVLFLALRIMLLLVGIPAAADPTSDLFEPDALRTRVALQKRTAGLTDPLNRECALPAGPISLSQAMEVALCRNPATRAAWAAARQQAAVLGSSESAWLPSVGVTGSAARAYGDHVDVTGATVGTPQDTRDAAVILSWTLYDFGGRGAHIANARGLLDAAAATVGSVSQQTLLAVVQGYYGVVAGDATLAAARSSESAAARSRDIAEAVRGAGVATLADVLQAETAYDLTVLARIQAEAAAKVARGALAIAIGVSADDPLQPDAEAVPVAVPMLSARMADLIQEAERQRPDLAAARAQRDAAQANVAVARAVGRPSIALTAGRYISDTPGVANQNYGTVGVSITVPIFNGFSVAYGVRQAQAALEGSEANLEQARLTVSVGVWNAYYALDSANQQLTATATLIQNAENNQEVAMGRYKAGIGTILDVLTAQTAAASARVQRINAELGWQVARAQLALALGRLTGTDSLNRVSNIP